MELYTKLNAILAWIVTVMALVFGVKFLPRLPQNGHYIFWVGAAILGGFAVVLTAKGRSAPLPRDANVLVLVAMVAVVTIIVGLGLSLAR